MDEPFVHSADQLKIFDRICVPVNFDLAWVLIITVVYIAQLVIVYSNCSTPAPMQWRHVIMWAFCTVYL